MLHQQKGFRKIFAGLQLAGVGAMAMALAIPTIAHAQACDRPPTGTMVAWYPFDEAVGNTSANLATGNTGVWSPTPPTPVDGVVAGALNFNGINNYVDMPDSIVTNFGPAGGATCGGSYSTCQGNFSIDVWVYVPSFPSYYVYAIVDKRDSHPHGYELALYGNSFYSPYTSMVVQLADSTGYTIYGSPSLPDLTAGAWHHVAITVKRRGTPSGLLTWYLDGASKGTSAIAHTGSLVNHSPLRIGANGAANGGSNSFNGSMDELEIFNRVLTPAEVQAIFAAGSSGKCKP
jgi:hypothetical protein